MFKLSLESFYNLLEHFDNYDPNSPIGKMRKQAWLEFLAPRKSLLGKKALELACGGGILSFVLDELGLDVIGVDIQRSMIEKALEFGKRIGSRARFIQGDIKFVDLGEKFDSIFFVGNSIIHFSIDDFEEVLKNVKKHLNPHGVFLIEYSDFIWEIFNRNIKSVPVSIKMDQYKLSYDPEKGCVCILIITKKVREDLYEAEKHCYYLWSPWILEEIMTKNGFKKIERHFLKNNTYIDIYQLN